MTNPFLVDDGPQPPKLLSAPLEILANLRLLQKNNTPLLVRFNDRNLRFQSYVVEIRAEQRIVALDELVPREGEKLLERGEPFSIVAFHEGIRISWECHDPVRFDMVDGARCYWCYLPEQMTYHQKRGAYRAPIGAGQLVSVLLSGNEIPGTIEGQLQDLSATGCKVRFNGNLSEFLQTGKIYPDCQLNLATGNIASAVELRHVAYEEKRNQTSLGLKFHDLSGPQQRLVERLVYQLQREARRFET